MAAWCTILNLGHNLLFGQGKLAYNSLPSGLCGLSAQGDRPPDLEGAPNQAVVWRRLWAAVDVG